MKLKNNRIVLDQPVVNPKKITGTRFASIFGLNPYSTPLQVWAEITHSFEVPFEDTKYTLAGKIIEPKQAEYIKNNYEHNLAYPKDFFGENYFNTTHGNFFEDTIFGGMWDYLGIDVLTDKPHTVFEMKTASKSKANEWAKGKIPEYYALQAALYAWLLNIEHVVMVVTFLDTRNGDYDHPENFIVSENNTFLTEFYVSKRYPNFETDFIIPAKNWWNSYVLTGKSPEIDPEVDAELLRCLKLDSSTTPNTVQSLDDLMLDIQNTIYDKPSDMEALKRQYRELPIAIYYNTVRALQANDPIAIAKVESAKLALDVLKTILTISSKDSLGVNNKEYLYE